MKDDIEQINHTTGRIAIICTTVCLSVLLVAPLWYFHAEHDMYTERGYTQESIPGRNSVFWVKSEAKK